MGAHLRASDIGQNDGLDHARVDPVPEGSGDRRRAEQHIDQHIVELGEEAQAVAEWGCGTSCMTGAVVDLQTGDVAFLPGSVSGWGLVDLKFKAAEYRLGSSLIVLLGQFNEEGPIGSHYFHFSDLQFRYLGTVLTSDGFKTQLGARWLPEVVERVAIKPRPQPQASAPDTLTTGKR